MNSPATPASARRRTTAVLIAALLAIAVAGCGGSKEKSGTSSSASNSTAGGTGGGFTDADVAAIKSAYVKFFNPATSLQESASLLQDGAAFKDALAAQAKTTQAKTASATVSKVTAKTPNTAVVTFTILFSGSPVLKDTPGYAVREKGVWKVAGITFCGLLVLNGGAPAACNTAAATSLPS